MRKPLNVFESLIALKPLKPLTVEALESVDAFWKFLSPSRWNLEGGVVKPSNPERFERCMGAVGPS